jgi:hypothetical protein
MEFDLNRVSGKRGTIVLFSETLAVDDRFVPFFHRRQDLVGDLIGLGKQLQAHAQLQTPQSLFLYFVAGHGLCPRWYCPQIGQR